YVPGGGLDVHAADGAAGGEVGRGRLQADARAGRTADGHGVLGRAAEREAVVRHLDAQAVALERDDDLVEAIAGGGVARLDRDLGLAGVAGLEVDVAGGNACVDE